MRITSACAVSAAFLLLVACRGEEVLQPSHPLHEVGGVPLQANVWSPVAPMPTGRSDPGIAVTGGILYAVGGYNPVLGFTGTVEAYDASTNVWATKASMPTPRNGPGMAVVNGIVYAVGGGSNFDNALSTVEAYDPSTDTWATKASMPTARLDLAVAALNGVLYAFGGWRNGPASVATVDAYDPVTDTWTARSPMPVPRSGAAVAVANGKFYVIGGARPGSFIGPVAEYDPATDLWVLKAPIPTPRFRLGAGSVNNVVYAVGGINDISQYATVEAYDPSTDSWTTELSMPTTRYRLGVGVVNGILYAIGGFDSAVLDIVEALEPPVATNVAPIVTGIVLPGAPVAVATPLGVTATFTDANSLDSHTATMQWGDATTSSALVSESNGSGTTSGTHSYLTPGVYTVGAMVSDGSLSDTRFSALDVPAYIVVYDPSAGFVTGGGWINSPAGAYAPNPSLAGKATFGFVAKYQKGANTPSGDTQFQFTTASFTFKSLSYDWLVVAGAKAQYKGSGAINGGGDYAFMLTAVDGQTNGGGGIDKFRMKIWDKANGGLIHDNQVGASDDAALSTALGGGSIVIHQ